MQTTRSRSTLGRRLSHATCAAATLAAVLALGFAAPGSPQEPQPGSPVETIRSEFQEARRARSLGIDQCLGWIDRLYAVADESPGGEECFQALSLVLDIAGARTSGEIERAASKVYERLIASYVNEVERIGRVVAESKDEAFVQRVMEVTSDPSVRATVLYREVEATIDAGYAAAIPDEAAAGALAAARRIRDECEGAKNWQGQPFAEVVAGDLFQLERLRIGMVAPDIEGTDLDGVPFKLSDYRGKVLVLDFWGNW